MKGKFKKWLIHKLGGVLREETIAQVPVNYTITKRDLIKLHSQAVIYEGENPTRAEVEEFLKDRIFELIKLKIKIEYNEEFRTKTYKATLEVPEQYVIMETEDEKSVSSN